MKKYIPLILILLSTSALAGTAKFRWEHDSKGVDESTVTLTKFRIYYGVKGTALAGIIDVGPPLPQPVATASGLATYEFQASKPEWAPGQEVCFEAAAFADTLESARAPQICQIMPPVAPKAPRNFRLL